MGKPVRVQVPSRIPLFNLKGAILAFFCIKFIGNSVACEERANTVSLISSENLARMMIKPYTFYITRLLV